MKTVRGIFILSLLGILIAGCEKDKKVPIVQTSEVSNISWTTAESGGSIIDDNGFTVVQRGVIWSTKVLPTISDKFSIDGAGAGEYSSQITDLIPNTTYYVRAYAQNSEGIGYGMTLSFKTKESETGVVETGTVTDITATSAISGGNVISDGGTTILAQGVCWSTNPVPTIADNITTDATGTGNFVSTITQLQPATIYYLRSYVTNAKGTTYGLVISFATKLQDIDNNLYDIAVLGTQTWMTQNLRTTTLNDNSPISPETNGTSWAEMTTPGYCWYNNDEVTHKPLFGALYNWYAVETGKLCPDGWHVPTDNDWVTLLNYLGGASSAGGKMKQAGLLTWISPNTGATNESGFNALGSGFRFYLDGQYKNKNIDTYFWSSTQDLTNTAWRVGLSYSVSTALHSTSTKPHGFSVRCIKN